MKLVLVGWGVEPEVSGGMDIHVSRVAENIAIRGHDVRLFVPAFNATENFSKNVLLQKIDVGAMPRDLHGIISSVKKYNKKIFSSLKNVDFDAIHTHDWLGAQAGLKAKKELGKKWVHTVHSLEFMRRGESRDARKSPIERIEKLAIENADIVLTVSKFMQAEILKKYGKNVGVIYNAPSVPEAPAKITREENRLFFAGRLAEQKGLKYLFYSMREVAEKVPDAKLVIAGTGHLREPLEEFSKSLGIEKSVEFLGFVGKEKLIEEYQKATLFVSPSVFEPFGITILDAAVLGVPIIATERTGALELFSEGSVAVVNPEDAGELAEKIILLLRDKKMREGMAEKAKKDVLKAKGWGEIAGEVESMFAHSSSDFTLVTSR